jgi:hypothetical protein
MQASPVPTRRPNQKASDEDGYYEVEKVIGYYYNGSDGQNWYEVKWKNYDESHNSYVAESWMTKEMLDQARAFKSNLATARYERLTNQRRILVRYCFECVICLFHMLTVVCFIMQKDYTKPTHKDVTTGTSEMQQLQQQSQQLEQTQTSLDQASQKV